MSTRRAFLGTLGKALGEAACCSRWPGKGALALPADLAKAASVPVAPTPLPVSHAYPQSDSGFMVVDPVPRFKRVRAVPVRPLAYGRNF